MGAVSQFTLYGVLKGNKPDFHVAMPPELAKPFYESFLERVRKTYNPDTVKGSSIILNNLFYFYVSLKSSCLLYFFYSEAFDDLLKVFSYILHNSII